MVKVMVFDDGELVNEMEGKFGAAFVANDRQGGFKIASTALGQASLGDITIASASAISKQLVSLSKDDDHAAWLIAKCMDAVHVYGAKYIEEKYC